MGRDRRQGGNLRFWLGWLALLAVLLALSELAWSVFGVGVLFGPAAASLGYQLLWLSRHATARRPNGSKQTSDPVVHALATTP